MLFALYIVDESYEIRALCMNIMSRVSDYRSGNFSFHVTDACVQNLRAVVQRYEFNATRRESTGPASTH